MADVDFYFDYSCPWSYVAQQRLLEIAMRNGAVIRWRPVLLDRVFAIANPALLNSRFDLNSRRAAYQRKDIADWANYWGLQIKLPDDWPRPVDAAALVAVAATAAGKIAAYSQAVFQAGFAAGANLNDPALVSAIAVKAGLEKRNINAALTGTDSVAELERYSAELLARGGFGTPTIFIGDDMYFGNDHLTLVEWLLGPAGQAAFVVPGQHG